MLQPLTTALFYQMATTKKNPGGAPREFNRLDILNRVKAEMAKGTRNFEDICSDEGMPHPSTIYLWITEEGKEAEKLYEIFMRAQQLWCLAQKEICIKISEDQSRDIIENEVECESGAIRIERRSDNTAVNRDKLRINTRQWAMAKLMPKLFGDKVQQELSGSLTITPVLNYKPKESK